MTRSALVFGAVVSLVLLGTPAPAGSDVDLGASLRIGDDEEIYFAISARYFGKDRGVVESVAVRYRNPDDLAVSLFIAKHSGQSIDAVHALRRKELSWWDVSVRLGVPMDAWFVELKRNPQPPYGKAYGHWKKHRRDKSHVVVLGDDDIRNLVAVRVLHDYYDVPAGVAMKWRASGDDLRVLVASEYHKRHHGGHGAGHGKVGKNHNLDRKAHGKSAKGQR